MEADKPAGFRSIRLETLLKRLEVRALILWAAAAGALWAFLVVAGEMNEGETAALDRRLLLALRTPGHPADPLGPLWLQESMRDLTALGGVTLLTLLTVTAVVTLLFHGKWRHALVMGGTVVLAQISSEVLKAFYDRPRPTLVPHGSFVYSASFPSGHSTLAAATYLTLAAVIARLEGTRRAKIFVFILALLIIPAVGFSRVYLGVHWPSDVLAGWSLGSLWALGALIALQALRPSTAAPSPSQGEPTPVHDQNEGVKPRASRSSAQKRRKSA
jgi:undecaprenyl-diphosphatase